MGQTTQAPAPCPRPAPSQGLPRLPKPLAAYGHSHRYRLWRRCHYLLLLSENRHALATRDVGRLYPTRHLGEGGGVAGTRLTRPWAIPLIVAGGALVSGTLVYFVAPTAKGHGTDNAIHAVHHDPTALKGKVAAVKIIASSLVIGSGGSGGREGPTAQISATVISSLCKKLKIATPDARIAVSAATASGIGAIFRAPLGGALLGAELLYRDDMESDAIMPSLVSSIVAFVVFGSVYGFEPIFGSLSGVQFSQPLQLIWFVLLGLTAGLMGKLYVEVFYSGTTLFDRLDKVPGWLVPAIGGLGVGLLGLLIPAALGTGYGSVQQEMFANNLVRMPLLMVLAIPFAKILSTTLSIGSGGSGGVFGPGMVIGGATGAALWRLLEGLPGIPSSPMSFVIVGMIACFGAVAHAPLGVLLMVGEMTGNLSMLAPGMIAVAVAGRVVGDTSIYTSQLKDRLEGRRVHAMGRVTKLSEPKSDDEVASPKPAIKKPSGKNASLSKPAAEPLAKPQAKPATVPSPIRPRLPPQPLTNVIRLGSSRKLFGPKTVNTSCSLGPPNPRTTRDRHPLEFSRSWDGRGCVRRDGTIPLQ